MLKIVRIPLCLLHFSSAAWKQEHACIEIAMHNYGESAGTRVVLDMLDSYVRDDNLSF